MARTATKRTPEPRANSNAVLLNLSPTSSRKKSLIRSNSNSKLRPMRNTNTKTSNFSGNENAQENSSSNKLTNSMEVVGLVGIVGLLGITLVLVSKNLK